MDSVLFVLAWIVVGLIVCFIAFQGGAAGARERLAAGTQSRGFKIAIPLLYIGCGIAIPALVIAAQS